MLIESGSGIEIKSLSGRTMKVLVYRQGNRATNEE